MTRDLLTRTTEIATAYLEGLPSRPVHAVATNEELRAALDVDLPDAGLAPVRVIEELARTVEPGTVASAGPRFFGFVVGGSQPAALAADWLTSSWDQNAQAFALSPAAAVVEDVVARWLLELLGLPRSASVGFVTGAQMANFVGLAAARHEVLRRLGWDVEGQGLIGAPQVDIVVGDEAHGTVFTALRMLGLGTGRVRRVPVDAAGRMAPAALAGILGACGPATIVCAQAGHVNTGAFDPLVAVAERTRAHGAWLHIDGAFGLWAAASPTLRGQVEGLAQADSWAVDAHKWLNVPYDSGIAIVAHPAAHEAALAGECAYVGPPVAGRRDGLRYGPENSRRARGFVLYAALRALGRQGVAELIERSCAQARRLAGLLSASPLARVLNDVCLNQVLVSFGPEADSVAAEALTVAIAEDVRAEGACWVGTTTWRGRTVLRLSLCNWSTTEADVDRCAAALLGAARAHSAPR